jgi:hypothetical protein
MEQGGERIAELLGVEAAYITPSCTSALAYSRNRSRPWVVQVA